MTIRRLLDGVDIRKVLLTTEVDSSVKEDRLSRAKEFASAINKLSGVDSAGVDDYSSTVDEVSIVIYLDVAKKSVEPRNEHRPMEFKVKPVKIANAIKKLIKNNKEWNLGLRGTIYIPKMQSVVQTIVGRKERVKVGYDTDRIIIDIYVN